MQRTVTYIPPTISQLTSAPIDSTAKRKVAAYARVSTDHEEQQSSYEAQVDYYTQYIKSRDDWEFAGIYADEGVTGTSTRHREGFNSMVADALAGKIDLIVTKSVSRFARNTVDSLTTIRKLKEHGTEVYFEKESIWTFDAKGEMLLTILSSLSQEESRSISENVRWGQRKKFSDGKFSLAYSTFLGYDKGEDGTLVVNAGEAEIVRKIFRLFLQGKSPYGIAKLLTEEGIPTPTGKKKWCRETVRRMLSNEKYRGDALLQKTYTTDFLTKKTKLNHGEVPQFYVENSHEAIIDPLVFEQVQRELKRRMENGTHRSSLYPFSGRIKCGCCGGWYGSKVWHSTDKYKRIIWQCNQKYKKAAKCTTPIVGDETMKSLFVKAANIALSEKDAAIATFEKFIRPTLGTEELEKKQAELLGEITVITEMVNSLDSRNAHTAMNQDEFRSQHKELLERYEAEKKKYDAVTAEISGKKDRLKGIEEYLKTLSERDGFLTEYDEDFWYRLVDFVTVYAEDDIRFTMKDGTEIKA